MLTKETIETILDNMSDNLDNNIKIIKEYIPDLEYVDENNNSLLHIFVSDIYEKHSCFLVIYSLLNMGISPNLEDFHGRNFIQTALTTGYSENFIMRIIIEALKFKLNVNHIDFKQRTIMHTAIYSDNYTDEIVNIYNLLCVYNFDFTKVDCLNKDIYESVLFRADKYSGEQISEFAKYFYESKCNFQTEQIDLQDEKTVQEKNGLSLSRKQIEELEEYGKILNNKQYLSKPTVGREKELRNLIITLDQDDLNPLLVGESGVGKTAIVDELVYQIQTNNVPRFLQNRIILEINPTTVVQGCTLVGEFEEKMNKLMKLCNQHNIIVFIDEIHRIYGIGSSKGKDNDMASMLQYYIDRYNLKVIGTTTTTDYNEYFSSNALKRRFEKQIISESNEDVLYQIIDKTLEDYSIKKELKFENDNVKDEVIKILINVTKPMYRVYDDKVNNPSLVIQIISKSFAIARSYDSNYIKPEHFIEGIDMNCRIYDSAKQKAIKELKDMKNNTRTLEKSKILTLNMIR